MVCLLGMAPLATAQNQPTLVPVDRAVADLDPLSTSLRRVDPGLRINGGEHSVLFQPAPDYNPQPWLATPNQQPVYYRVGQGFQAKIDRPQYLFSSNSALILELIPPNTTFILEPIPQPTPPPTPAGVNPQLGTPLDTRISNRIDPNAAPTTPVNYDLHIPIRMHRDNAPMPPIPLTTTPPPQYLDPPPDTQPEDPNTEAHSKPE